MHSLRPYHLGGSNEYNLLGCVCVWGGGGKKMRRFYLKFYAYGNVHVITRMFQVKSTSNVRVQVV